MFRIRPAPAWAIRSKKLLQSVRSLVQAEIRVGNDRRMHLRGIQGQKGKNKALLDTCKSPRSIHLRAKHRDVPHLLYCIPRRSSSTTLLVASGMPRSHRRGGKALMSN